MRTDQLERLQALAEKLVDVVLIDLDTSRWCGAGLHTDEMTQQQRGDAYWSRKMPLASLSVTMRTFALLEQVQAPNLPTVPVTDSDGDEASGLDADIRETERQAAKLMAALRQGARP